MSKANKITKYGIVLGILTLALQHCVYLLSNEIAGVIGITPFSPKIGIDNFIPVVTVFIFPYVWSYAHWAITPMVVSKCDREYYLDYMAMFWTSMLIGALILIFAPTYMDRVAEGLTDVNRSGLGAGLMRFWYSLDGGDMAYNLLPSFHCINTTVCMLGVLGRKEISKGFKIYAVVIAVLIYLATVFVKQHFVLDVVSGVAIGFASYYIAMHFHCGKYLRITPRIMNLLR